MQQLATRQSSHGVALLAALLVLTVMSIIGIGLLMNVDDELKMSKRTEDSEQALKIAEAGVQIARSTFFDPSVKNITGVMELASIDGFYDGGYFLAQLESGIYGNEKWVQWRYDEGVSGNNNMSEVTSPVFRVWASAAPGVNGQWDSWGDFVVKNIYGIIAGGTYFTIETVGGDTEVRAHDEYTGKDEVDPYKDGTLTWKQDKALKDTSLSTARPFSGPVNHAVGMSPMVSFSNYSTRVDGTQYLLQQTLYFVYSGHDQSIGASSADRDSTVRLRAVNALCNNTADGDPLESIWEFDTGLHGEGTAPALFDPTPDEPGDEILYFVVAERGKAGSDGALNLNAANVEESRVFPSKATSDPEQLYLFAVIDTTGKLTVSDCGTTGSYRLKWAHPFPDPDVVEWTDYATEHATGSDGFEPPYVRVPSDMTPFLPEDDLLADYRDGPGTQGSVVRADGTADEKSAYDGQWNQIRGNFMGGSPSVSPPVVQALYLDGSGNLITNYNDATTASQDDPRIDIYLMYSALTRVTYLRPVGAPWVGHWFWNDVRYPTDDSGAYNSGWGPPGYRKPNTVQTRIIALRDRLVKEGNGWNWNAAASRFPTFKWSYIPPGKDPDPTDARPPRAYGVYNWENWFDDQIAPMVNTVSWNQAMQPADGDVRTEWDSMAGDGSQNLYTVIYPYYKSAGFVHGGAEVNDTSAGRGGPTVADGSIADFSAQVWTDSAVMMMAIRDTWDDYMEGAQTNPLYDDIVTGGNDLANPIASNPVEPYWVHRDGTADPLTDKITYNASLNAQYPANSDKIGFPRPYTWWEELWTENIRSAADDAPHSLYNQGWKGVVTTHKDITLDADVEGETSAMCKECLQQDGLIVMAFNHDLSSNGDSDGYDAEDREDLRVHGINATSGQHVWDYHMPASLPGDDANSSPAIANNHVFVAYQQYGDKSVAENRRALLQILDADFGTHQQLALVDQDADAVVMSPSIANGAVYVATYDFNGTSGAGTEDNDYIRLFAMSPVLRLVSTGVYPFDYSKYVNADFSNLSTLDHDSIFKLSTSQAFNGYRRKIQVWVTGGNSKWEEVREVLE